MRRTVTLGGLAVVNLAAAFLAQWLVMSTLSIGRQTDALIAAMALPQVVLTIMSGPLSNVLVPMFAGLTTEEADDRASSTVFAIAAVTVPATAILYAAAPWWAPALVPGFDEDATALVIRLAQIQVLGLLVAPHHAPIWALAQARHRFVWTETGLALASIAVLFAVEPVARQWGIEGVAWLFAGRSALRVAAMLPASQLRPRLRFRPDHVRVLGQRVAPLMVSSVYYKSEVLVDRFLASMAPAGAISILNLAQLMHNAAVGVLTNALLVPSAPKVGELARNQRWSSMRALIRSKALLGLGASVGSLLALAVVGLPLLELLVGLGGVTEQNVFEIWLLALALGGTLVVPVSVQVLNYGFYAIGETRRLSVISAASYTLGLGFKIGGFFLGGVRGLALGTSAYFGLSLLLIVVTLSRLLGARQSDAAGEDDGSQKPRCPGR